MIIKSAAVSPDQIPTGLSGVYARATRWGLVIQAKPKKGGRRKTQNEKDFIKRFSIAGVMASNMQAKEMETAIEMSRGTEQVPRDICTMACLGRYYIFHFEDGGRSRVIRTAKVSDPKAWRAPSLAIEKFEDPALTRYLVNEDGNRILQCPLTPATSP